MAFILSLVDLKLFPVIIPEEKYQLLCPIRLKLKARVPLLDNRGVELVQFTLIASRKLQIPLAFLQ